MSAATSPRRGPPCPGSAWWPAPRPTTGASTRHAEAAVAEADIVQENAPERLPIKRELYAQIDNALRPDAILASSTSGLIMSEMQAGFRSAPRFAVGHPFNPPHLIPLVEVVGGQETAPETIAWCLEFYRHIGKKPIHIRKEARGHLANRLQAALWREAVSAVVTGLASVEDVDTAISAGPGLRWAAMGPHMTFHLGGGEGGIEHLLAQFKPAFESWWETMSTPDLSEANCRAIIDGVRAEAAGRSMTDLVKDRDAILLPLLELVSPPEMRSAPTNAPFLLQVGRLGIAGDAAVVADDLGPPGPAGRFRSVP